MYRTKLDEIDIQLLEILQKNGRIKRRELAEQVGLTIPSVSERLNKLEKMGIIKGYGAFLDPLKVNLEVTAFIVLISESSTHYQEVVELAQQHEEIQECHAITGEGSHLLKARTRNTRTLERLLSQVQSWPGVKNTRTSIVLSSPKETTVLPLHYVLEENKKG